MEHSYWRKQTASKPLFPDIEWNKPERKDQGGKLLIVGGNKLGFSAAAESYELACELNVGYVRVLLPDALKKAIPATLLDVQFGVSNPSGSLAADAKPELIAGASWSDQVIMIGDAGRNAETAVVYEQFLQDYQGHLTITRDAVDLIKNNPKLLAERNDTLIIASFAQIQKLFQSLYYPKMLTFNMQLMQFVEALHKFTITYPCTIMTLHKDSILVAHGGEVVTQTWENPMAIWRGNVATKAAAYWLWSPGKILESTSYSLTV